MSANAPIVHEDGPYTVSETRRGRFEVQVDGVTVATRIAVVALRSREDGLAECLRLIANHKGKLS